MMKKRILTLGLFCLISLAFQPQDVWAQNNEAQDESIESDDRDLLEIENQQPDERNMPTKEDYEARNAKLRQNLLQQMEERREMRAQQEQAAIAEQKAAPPQSEQKAPEKKRYIYTPQNESNGQSKLWNTY